MGLPDDSDLAYIYLGAYENKFPGRKLIDTYAMVLHERSQSL